MSKLTFETLSFRIEQDQLIVTLLKQFQTSIPLEEINILDKIAIPNPHTLEFLNLPQEKAEKKFSLLLTRYFDHLTNRINNNPATYIHQNSNIPLIGNVAFGIVYRNSSIIEIKPITSCNLNCIYCSLSEGRSSKKQDFVIEKDYLLQELDRLIEFIAEPVETHIGVQGEPFLYADLLPLIEELEQRKMVHRISMDTNGTLVSKEKIDQLAKNKKLQLNFSLDALEEEKAKFLSGSPHYSLKHIQEMIAYSIKKGISVIIAPVLLPKHNEEEIEKIITFGKSLSKRSDLRFGIQNFLNYKTGKNPVRQWEWQRFYDYLKQLEEKHKVQLHLKKEDFNIHPAKELSKPFQEGDIIEAQVKCPDRFLDSVIAVAKERTISVPNCKYQKDKIIKIKITRDKHNIFSGKLVR